MKINMTQTHKSHNVALIQGCVSMEADTGEEFSTQDAF